MIEGDGYFELKDHYPREWPPVNRPLTLKNGSKAFDPFLISRQSIPRASCLSDAMH